MKKHLKMILVNNDQKKFQLILCMKPNLLYSRKIKNRAIKMRQQKKENEDKKQNFEKGFLGC